MTIKQIFAIVSLVIALLLFIKGDTIMAMLFLILGKQDLEY